MRLSSQVKQNKLLINFFKKDQLQRRLYRLKKITKERLQKGDFRIAKNFKLYLKKYGFPYNDEVNRQKYKIGVTLVLHLPLKDFKKIVLHLLKSKENQVLPFDKAYFIDRLRVYEKKPQLYGTQFHLDKSRILPFPIYQPKKLRLRRRKMGLGSYEVYKTKMKKILKKDQK